MMQSPRETPCRTSGSTGFTLIELLTVIAIIGILASILIPVVSRVRDSARDALCMSNVRQWGMAVLLYAEEHNGRYAVRDNWEGGGASSWPATTAPYQDYLEQGERLRDFRMCPLEEQVPPGVHYAMNWPDVNGAQPPRNNIPLAAAREPSALLLIVDAARDANPDPFVIDGTAGSAGRGAEGVFALARGDYLDRRHRGNMNAVFADGHAKQVHWYSNTEDGTDGDSFVDQWDRWTSIYPGGGNTGRGGR